MEKQNPSNRKYTDYAVEVIKLVFKVQKQSFIDVTFLRTPHVAASQNLRNVFAQKKFFLPLKLRLYHIYFHFYSFTAGMTKMSSNIFFNNVLFKRILQKGMHNEKLFLK